MAEFIPNPLFEKELAALPGVAAALRAKAEVVAGIARDIAPVGHEHDQHPGQFRDSIKATTAEHHAEPTARVESDDPAAAYIIFGTSNTPPHDTFRRAAEIVAGTDR